MNKTTKKLLIFIALLFIMSLCMTSTIFAAGTTRTWDGEGENNNWSTAKNWSGDVVPNNYDIVIFDSTSIKNVNVDGEYAVYDFIIKEGYTGMISGETLTITNDFQMNGGNIYLTKLNVNGTTNITAGERLICNDFYTYGDVNISGLENPIESEMHICKDKNEDKATTINGDFEVSSILFDESNHDYQVNSCISINKRQDSWERLEFTNKGNVSINEGAKIDISKCHYCYTNYNHSYYYDYDNSGTITENGTGRLYFDANDFYFCDSEGYPVIKSSIGEKIFISLTDFDANLDKNQRDTVTVIVKRESDLNDTLALTLTETENDSSIFRNIKGLELVATDSKPLEGKLKYDGSENLIAEYTDSNSPEDKKSCKMDRDPIIWDGEGKEDYGDPITDWNCDKNWSTDIAPKMYDIVLFNNTSSKNVLQNRDYEISKIVVDEGYTGEIKFEDYDPDDFKTKVFNDIVVKDGTITLNSNMTINGDVDIQGGILSNEFSSSNNVINGNLDISGGEFKFLGDYLKLEGNLNVSSGSFFIGRDDWSNSEIYFYGNADISGGTIDINKAYIKDVGNTITINNIDGNFINELFIEKNTELEGNIGVGALTLNENRTLDINGTLTCYDSFSNNGTINVTDGSILDFKNVMTYKNNIINDNETGKILYDAGGIGFVIEESIPITTANVGDEICIELIDLSKNNNTEEKETVTVTVSSLDTGDTETILLTETCTDTSVFRSEKGLKLISTDTLPSVGQLQFNGSEDLEAVYVDDRDENDTVSCNLHREPIIWDGGGADNNWITSENWSTDTVPSRYDSITLNDTSSKDINFDNNIEMYKFLVEESYTGEMTGIENASFYSASDVTIDGGIINISGRFQTGGNLTVSGGSIDIQNYGYYKHNIIGGNLSVSDGKVLAYGYFDIKGNMSILGGSFNPSYEGADAYICAYGDVDLQTETNVYNMQINGNNLNCSTEKENFFTCLDINTDGNVNITGEIKTEGFFNQDSATTDISGEGTIITLDDEGCFSNKKVLNIKDGAIFNASNYNYTNDWNDFDNCGQIIEADGGKFYCDTKDMFFTNANGDRIVFADVGDEVFVKLVDGNLNLDGSKKEEVTITVKSVLTGDSEDITLTEIESWTGIFTNNSGLLLVADDTLPNDGKLKYNGTEDLQASYTDSTDPEDTYTCNLFRNPLIWDGDGEDNYWYTPENWSEDRIPDEYDRIVFNGTSSKNAEQGWNVGNVYSITIEDSYKGIVKVSNNLNVEEDVIVNGGKLEIGDWDSCSYFNFQANGDLMLGGGMIEYNSYGEDTFNNVIITGGELKPYDLKVKNNFEMTGGKIIDYNGGELTVEGDVILTNAEKFEIDDLEIYGDTTLTNAEKFYCWNLKIYGNNINITGDKFSTNYLYIYTDGEVNLNGNISLIDDFSSRFEIGSNSILNLNGKIEFREESERGLQNSGTLNIKNNSILDLRKARKFENSGTITISDTAKLYFNTEAMGVTDKTGAPALDKFTFGDDLIVSLIDKNQNLNNSVAENVEVKLINWTNGDEEIYTLVETGTGTYEFRGAGFTTSSCDTATKGNNNFEGQDSDAFQITYTDIMSGRVEYVVSKNCAELDIDGIDDLIVDGIDYGNGDINGNSNTYIITLQNRGDKPLGIQEISLDNTENFSFSEEPDISDMEPDSTRDINIDFKPTSLGEKTANLTIKTNDNDEGLITIPLKGIGVEPPISSGIDDITVLQGTENYEINVFETFEDAQDSDEDLEYSIINNYGSLVIGAVADKTKGTLTLQFSTFQSGEEFITLRATDTSNAYVDEQFKLTVLQSFTISGKTVDSDGNAIEGATVKIMDYCDNEKYYTGTTSSDGTFSVSYPTDEINTPIKIRISKDALKYTYDCDECGDVYLGNITLSIETDEQKAQRLANDLNLGLQNGDFSCCVTDNLLLVDTAGEGSTIEWSSSKIDVISDSGEVTRPAHGSGDEDVIMTATVHVNEQTVQREFYVTVREIEANTISICMPDTHKMIEEREYQTPIIINIKRTGDLEGTATVDYSTVDDIAEAGSDYTQNTGILTFLSGETDKTITLSINDDNLYEHEESFKLILSNPTGNIIIGESEYEIEIMDDDPMPDYEAIGLCSTRFRVMEGESAQIYIERMNGTDSAVTVDYTVQNNTAQSGSDFIAASGTLEFASGEDFKTISIDILDDSTYEGKESFKIILSNVTGGADIVIPKAKIIIDDNDPPNAPVLQSAVAGDEHVALTWDTVPGSTDYMVYVSTIPDVYEFPIDIVDSSVNSYDVTGLDNGKIHYFVVRAQNMWCESENSNELSATPKEVSEEPKTVPSEPTNVSATAGNGQAEVSFTAPVDNGGSEITEYIVTSSPGSITASGIDTTITVTGLVNGTEYTFTVKAVNDIGKSNSSVASNAVTPKEPTTEPKTVPSEPTNVSAIAGNGQAEVSFTAPVDNGGSEITEYIVTSSPGSITASGIDTTITVTGLVNGTEYTFTVKAVNDIGKSNSSVASDAVTPKEPITEPKTVPSEPTNVSAIAGNGQVVVSFTAPTDNGGSEITEYIVTSSPGSITASGIDTTITVTGLTNGTEYTFTVKAVNDVGNSQSSVASNSVTPKEPTIEPKTVPSEPTNVSVAAGNGQATVSFTAPVDNGGSEITGYIVTSSPGNITATGTDTTITITGLTNGTEYTFTVKAVNAIGESSSSEVSNAVTPYKPLSGGNNKHTKPVENGVDILVNGKTEKAATSTTSKVEGKKVTTVTVDDKKVDEKLKNEDNNAVVTIPVKNDSDVVVGQLNGQTVKNMETKEAVLEVKTENVTYTLPASQINIDNVSSEIGKQVALEDITVDVEVSEPSQNTVRIIEDTANKNNYQIVVKPIEFEINCTHGNKKVKVSKFKAYVERTIAIPDNIDASKITTGIVLNPDGTFSHVPTIITVIDGKYYAKINSLTNSSYSVIYSPKSFKDVESHWAKDSVNDMGSRLVITGVGDGYFKPDNDITRAEFATIVVKSLGLMRPGTGKDIFSDVTENDWYYDTVSIAYEYGIISGNGNGEFRPTEKITREQAMTIIARAMEITKLKVGFQNGEKDKLFKEFNDFEKSADWSKDSIVSCIKAEIIFGRNGKLIAPNDNITRAEVAVIVRRLLKISKLI